MNSPGESTSDPGLGRSSPPSPDVEQQATNLPDLRVEHTAGRCQPVTLYLNADHGTALAHLLRSRLASHRDARVRGTEVTVRFVPAFEGYEPWTADPLDPFDRDAADEVTIGIPPERVEDVAAGCEGSPGAHTWSWFPELKIVRY
jgi:hypothetical protein